jgi:hypothetical protein
LAVNVIDAFECGFDAFVVHDNGARAWNVHGFSLVLLRHPPGVRHP